MKLAKAKKIAIARLRRQRELQGLRRGSDRDAIEKYCDDIGGAKVAYFNDDLAFGLPNGSDPRSRAMKDAGVDMIFGCMDLNGHEDARPGARRQGMADVHTGPLRTPTTRSS